jgi:outer membrane protein assembly factor BamD
MKSVKNTILIAAICLFLTGCNGYNKLLNSNDYDAKYAAAMKYYEENSFSRASQLFENLTLYYRGKENAENIGWYYAMSLYKMKDYFTAGYQFKRFARQFPYSEHMEEASYLSAYCKYMDSPEYNLDQTETKEAIEEFEAFAERWPRSTRIPEVNNCLDELRKKIIRKDYEIAYGYYFIEEYHAAYESFKQFLSQYPEATMREDAMYYMLESSYRYAINSREDKMYERLQQVVNDFDKFNSSFSNSKYLATAQDIYTKTREAMAKMKK